MAGRLPVLYSNTGKAHELAKTRDCVVLYFYDSDHRESRQTIVTETRGALQGKRVVRGREAALGLPTERLAIL